MDRYQMGCGCGRPYNQTCGMFRGQGNEPQNRRPAPCRETCSCKEEKKSCASDMYEHLQHLEPAMAYVPYQEWCETFDLSCALKNGTIFPVLCKPFCGKRGGCR